MNEIPHRVKIIEKQVGKMKFAKLPQKIAVIDTKSKIKMIIGGKEELEILKDFCDKALGEFNNVRFSQKNEK